MCSIFAWRHPIVVTVAARIFQTRQLRSLCHFPVEPSHHAQWTTGNYPYAPRSKCSKLKPKQQRGFDDSSAAAL